MGQEYCRLMAVILFVETINYESVIIERIPPPLIMHISLMNYWAWNNAKYVLSSREFFHLFNYDSYLSIFFEKNNPEPNNLIFVEFNF